jgi:hypothetical protein
MRGWDGNYSFAGSFFNMVKWKKDDVNQPIINLIHEKNSLSAIRNCAPGIMCTEAGTKCYE